MGGTVRAVSDDATDTQSAPGAAEARRPWWRPVAAAAAVVVVVVGAVVGLVRWRAGDDGADRLQGEAAVDAFVAAYTRNVDATFLVDGELTRTLDDGRTLTSAYLIVQRPPDHLQRSFGSTTGEVGGRSVNCSTPAGGTYTCGTAGTAEPWEAQRRRTLDALGAYVRGDDPVYEVTGEEGCFVLVRRRTEPDASFGQRARLCFDDTVGALRRLEVHHDGGATDVMLATRITAEVTDADFDLDADPTYDPQVPADTGTVPPTVP